jgi:hypothetical protein
MDAKKVRHYAWISLAAAVFSVVLTLLFSMTLFFQAQRDNNGRGLYVLPQFLSPQAMFSKELAITSAFDKGENYYDQDYDRRTIEEMLVRYYLTMRYTFFPNHTEMMYRWGWRSPLSRLASTDIHKEIVGKDLEQKIRDLGENVRTVNITSLKKDEKNIRALNVQMEIYVLKPDGFLEKIEKYNVIMHYGYKDRYKIFSPNFNNPYGMYFTYVKAVLEKE